MLLNTWSDALYLSFQSLWVSVVSFIPNIVVAIVIFVLGWAIGIVVGSWVSALVKSIKLDKALRAIGVGDVVERGGYKLDSGAFFGALVKWFIIVAFLVSSANVLGLSVINEFLRQVVLVYVPTVIVAVIILFIAAIVGGFLSRFVTASARASGLASANFFGALTKWAVWIFGLVAALTQIGVAAMLFQTLFMGLVAMLAIAGGIAFGLGGKEAASRLIDRAGRNL